MSDSLKAFLKYKTLSFAELKTKARMLGVSVRHGDTKETLYRRIRPKIVSKFRDAAYRKGVTLHANMSLENMYDKLTRRPNRRSPNRRSPHRRSPHRRSPHRRSPNRRSPHRRSPNRAQELLSHCGKQCFADSNLKYNICPFCSSSHCKCYPECDGLYAAYSRGHSKELMLGYGDLLKCNWAKNLPTSPLRSRTRSAVSLKRDFSSPKQPVKKALTPSSPVKKVLAAPLRPKAQPGKTAHAVRKAAPPPKYRRHDTVDFGQYKVGDKVKILFSKKRNEIVDGVIVQKNRRSITFQKLDDQKRNIEEYWAINNPNNILEIISDK